MNTETAQALSQKIVFLLVEKNCGDIELENAKSLVNLLHYEKRISTEDIVLLQVNEVTLYESD